MSWLKRDKHSDPSSGPGPSLSFAAGDLSYEEFLGVYSPSDATRTDLVVPLLLEAAGNHDAAARVAICSRLLDDGARADVRRDDGLTPVHRILSARSHDADLEAPLVRRLLDEGADVNARNGEGATPMESLASQFAFSDDTLAPFYDVLLERPDLDPLQPGLGDRLVLTNLRKWAVKRSALVARVEGLLRERGLDVPEA